MCISPFLLKSSFFAIADGVYPVRRSDGFANLVQTRVIQACLKNAECSRDSLREIRRQKMFDLFFAIDGYA